LQWKMELDVKHIVEGIASWTRFRLATKNGPLISQWERILRVPNYDHIHHFNTVAALQRAVPSSYNQKQSLISLVFYSVALMRKPQLWSEQPDRKRPF
jgi:hypothetical protein